MSEPREGRWLARPLKPRTEPMLLVSGMQVVWSLLMPLAMLAPGLSYPWHMALGGTVLLLMFLAPLGIVGRELALRRRTRRDRDLSDRAAGLEEFAVEIVVRQGRSVLGADRGLLWFDGALFGFSGARTSFLLAANDLRVRMSKGKVLSDFDAAYYPLWMKDHDVRLEVRPLLGHGRGYRRRMRAFLRDRLPSEEARQWPPLGPYDECKRVLAIGLESMVDESASPRPTP